MPIVTLKKREEMELPEKLAGLYEPAHCIYTSVLRSIYRGRSKNPSPGNDKVVIKRITRVKEKDVCKEIERLKSFNHLHIVKLLDDESVRNEIYAVMEFMEGDLRGYHLYKCSRFESDEAFNYLRQMAKALKYLHELRIIHRDIKPENMLVHHTLLHDGHRLIKLCDFGDSIHEDEVTENMEALGTPFFLAPSILPTNPSKPQKENDVWALGVCYYDWLVGKTPFAQTRLAYLYRAIKEDPYVVHPYFTQMERTLFELLLEKDLTKRISADALDKLINIEEASYGIINYDYYDRSQVNQHYTSKTFAEIWNICKLDDLECDEEICISYRNPLEVEFRSDEWVTFQTEDMADRFFKYCIDRIRAKESK